MANVSTVADATAGQTTGTRITKILDQVSFPTSMRITDTGSTTVQADPGTARTALAALKAAEFAEQARSLSVQMARQSSRIAPMLSDL